MAENETLDLWDRHSGRWQQLLDKIKSCEPAESIADETVRCLYKTFKNLVKWLPLERLIEAALRGNAAVRDVARDCGKAREYAELFVQLSAIHSDPVSLVEGVARATAERFLDQIEIEVVGDGHWPDMARFRVMRGQTMLRIKPAIARLAKQIVEKPNQKPRLPARTAEQKSKEQTDLLRLSLEPRSGTHG